MNKAVLIVAFGLFFQRAAAQETPSREPLVSVTIKNQPLPQALAIIEARVPIRFAYPTSLLRNQPAISITASAMPLHVFLTALFRQTTLVYRIIGDQVVLQAPTSAKVTLHGYIRDARTGEVLAGASIYVPGDSVTGVLSNNYGFYSLTVDVRDSVPIEVSYVGYRSGRRVIVDTAREMEEAEGLIKKTSYKVIIQDLRLGLTRHPDGIEIIKLVHQRSPETRIVVLTSYGSQEVEDEARRAGADAFLRKPKPLSQVAQVVQGLIESPRTRAVQA